MYFGYAIRRQNALEKTIMVGKADSSWKRGSPNMSYIDMIMKATGLKNVQDLNGAVNNGMFWRSSFTWLSYLGSDLITYNNSAFVKETMGEVEKVGY